jgi:hypothetical protein
MRKPRTSAARPDQQSAAREMAGRIYFETVRQISDDPVLLAAVAKTEADWERKTDEVTRAR